MNRRSENDSRAYWYGWNDGRNEEPCCFTENRRLAELQAPSDRLDYYRGHRAGSEARLRSSHVLRAS
jgi:hypothetical protein